MSANRSGTVLAVCLNPDPGIPKHPQPQVSVGPHGIEGDYHAGPTRLRRGDTVPNTRQVSLLAEEAIQDVCLALDITIPPGGLGENVLLRGLGDLSDLKEGDLLRFSSGVELEVSGQNDPCKILSLYHPQVPKFSYRRRGIVAVVRTPGDLKPGDTVVLS